MNREEAIANLNMISAAFVDPVTKEQRELIDETFDMAINALEQEPCDHYTEGYFKGYDDGQKGKLEQEPILDKIRAEIRNLDDINPDYPMDMTIHISRNEVLNIIDKYRQEG